MRPYVKNYELNLSYEAKDALIWGDYGAVYALDGWKCAMLVLVIIAMWNEKDEEPSQRVFVWFCRGASDEILSMQVFSALFEVCKLHDRFDLLWSTGDCGASLRSYRGSYHESTFFGVSRSSGE